MLKLYLGIYRAWHVGSGIKGSYNACAIGVEIYEPKGYTYNGATMIDYDVVKNEEYFNKVYDNAVELCAYLYLKYDLSPSRDKLCHSEVYKLGFGSNHADVMHWFPKHGKSMDTFREDVKNKMIAPTKTITKTSQKEDIKWLKEKLNKIIVGESNIPLKVDGICGNKTHIAVLIYWEKFRWNKNDTGDGWKAGAKTINALM